MHARPDPLEARPRYASRSLIALGVCLCVIALAAGGCGRRGKLEPPDSATRGSPNAAASPRSLPQGVGAASGSPAPDSDAVRDGDELPVAATPAGVDSAPVQTGRGSKRGYRIPKDPFILDPLL